MMTDQELNKGLLTSNPWIYSTDTGFWRCLFMYRPSKEELLTLSQKCAGNQPPALR